MTAFLIGTKVGMTRVFDEDGRDIPVTVVRATENTVTQVKNAASDGYHAIQVGTGFTRNITKPMQGHLKASGKTNLQTLRETRIQEGEDVPATGDVLSLHTFTPGDSVNVTGTSKGKGFAGVIKRHHFHRGPTTHGSDHHRAPGSIGSMFPQHVWKGKKMPGHLGHAQVTVKNSQVVGIDDKTETLLLKGALPGPKGSVLEIRKAI